VAQAATIEKATNGKQSSQKPDAVVIGAGVAALYQLHLLRSQGLTVKAFDTVSDARNPGSPASEPDDAAFAERRVSG